MIINVNTDTPYKVIVDSGIISTVGTELLRKTGRSCKTLIVSDSNVYPLYGDKVKLSLENEGFQVSRFVFEAGEQSKNLSVISNIYNALANGGFTRSDIIIALGGGVTGDMAGFAAATFLRGISYVQIPTSLLSQVDSSVGGKTGVDLKYGKNLVGAFHQPILVIADTTTLSTLPNHYKNDGMGEVIKYGCIDDKSLFNNLSSGACTENMNEVIIKCIDSKRRFVEEDTKDTGLRMVLNFGHTFGHAIERLQNYKGFSHGEAVGVGMLIAAAIGEELKITPRGTRDKIETVLKKYSLPTQCGFTAEKLLNAASMDKKSDGNMINLILLESIGKAVIYKMSKNELYETLIKVMG